MGLRMKQQKGFVNILEAKQRATFPDVDIAFENPSLLLIFRLSDVSLCKLDPFFVLA